MKFASYILLFYGMSVSFAWGNPCQVANNGLDLPRIKSFLSDLAIHGTSPEARPSLPKEVAPQDIPEDSLRIISLHINELNLKEGDYRLIKKETHINQKAESIYGIEIEVLPENWQLLGPRFKEHWEGIKKFDPENRLSVILADFGTGALASVDGLASFQNAFTPNATGQWVLKLNRKDKWYHKAASKMMKYISHPTGVADHEIQHLKDFVTQSDEYLSWASQYGIEPNDSAYRALVKLKEDPANLTTEERSILENYASLYFKYLSEIRASKATVGGFLSAARKFLKGVLPTKDDSSSGDVDDGKASGLSLPWLTSVALNQLAFLPAQIRFTSQMANRTDRELPLVQRIWRRGKRFVTLTAQPTVVGGLAIAAITVATNQSYMSFQQLSGLLGTSVLAQYALGNYYFPFIARSSYQPIQLEIHQLQVPPPTP